MSNVRLYKLVYVILGNTHAECILYSGVNKHLSKSIEFPAAYFFPIYNMKIVAKFILGGIKQTWAICPRIWVQCVFWADWIVSISWKVNFNLFLSKHFCLNLNICFEYIVPYCSMLLRFTHVHLTWYVPTSS